MHKLDENGKIGTVLLTLLFAAALLVLIAAIVLSQRKETVVVGSSGENINSPQAAEKTDAKTPADWQTYINQNNDYTIAYPASWGTVVLSEPSTDSFEYRFTTREEVVLRQAPSSKTGVGFINDYSIFNKFEEIRNNVLFCSSSGCDRSHSIPIERVRLFVNKNSRDVAEVFVEDGQALDMVGLVNSGRDDYPGLNIIVRVDEAAEGKNIVEKTMKANEELYDLFIELRDFLEYAR